MLVHPVPNLGVTAGTGISFWEVITGLAEFCELGSALVWALTLALALVLDMTLCCCGDRMLDEMPSGSFAAFALVSAELLPTQLPGTHLNIREKGKLLPQSWMVLMSAPWLAASQTCMVWESLPLGLGLHCNLHYSQPYPSSKNKAWHGQSWSSPLACIDLSFPLNLCATIV